ncbi:MAG: hypothetical protein JW922_10020 [Paludibacteraceae bacterium]|nr:hypothetical protein [Paludibacteraceae bacterium]
MKHYRLFTQYLKFFKINAMFVIFGLLYYGCSPNEQTQREATVDDTKRVIIENDTAPKGLGVPEKVIFYNVPSPIEMATMLEQIKAPFYSEILMSVDDIDKFYSASGQALALGVYGVDLGYIKLHEQTQEAIKYLAAVKKLTRKIGIPQEETRQAFEILEKNTEDRDILFSIMSETYSTADTYLKSNDRNSSAALILLGGWVEALHISLNIYSRHGAADTTLANRIAEQKYSLKTIIQLLSDNQYDTVVTGYYEKLLLLRKIFDEVDITYNDSDVAIDTIGKTITINTQSNIKITNAQITAIAVIITELRNTIVDFS